MYKILHGSCQDAHTAYLFLHVVYGLSLVVFAFLHLLYNFLASQVRGFILFNNFRNAIIKPFFCR